MNSIYNFLRYSLEGTQFIWYYDVNRVPHSGGRSFSNKATYINNNTLIKKVLEYEKILKK